MKKRTIVTAVNNHKMLSCNSSRTGRQQSSLSPAHMPYLQLTVHQQVTTRDTQLPWNLLQGMSKLRLLNRRKPYHSNKSKSVRTPRKCSFVYNVPFQHDILVFDMKQDASAVPENTGVIKGTVDWQSYSLTSISRSSISSPQSLRTIVLVAPTLIHDASHAIEFQHSLILYEHPTPNVLIHTSPSYKLNALTIVSSRLLPSLNSSMSKLPFSSLSIMRKILRTLFSGVSSSSGSLTIEPT